MMNFNIIVVASIAWGLLILSDLATDCYARKKTIRFQQVNSMKIKKFRNGLMVENQYCYFFWVKMNEIIRTTNKTVVKLLVYHWN